MFGSVVSAPVNVTASAFGRLDSGHDTASLVATAFLVFAVATLGIRRLSGLQLGGSIAKSARAQDEKPGRPPRIPHWIPWLGNTLQLVKLGFGGLAQKYREEVEGAPMVSILVAGETMHIVTDPVIFQAVFRFGMDTLSMRPMFEPLCENMFGGNAQTGEFIYGPVRKPINNVTHKLLATKDGLAVTNKRLQSLLMDRVKICMEQSGDGRAQFQLRDFTRKVIFNAVLQTIISNSAFDDEFCESYWKFDAAILNVAKGQDVKKANKPAYEARERIKAFLRSDSFQPSDFVLERNRLCSKHNGTNDDITDCLLLLLWSSVTNFIPSIFWMLYFVCSSQDTMKHLREEADAILSKRSADDAPFDGTFTMDEVNEMERAEAVLKESIRMSQYTIVSRRAMKDFVLDLKLKSGRQSKYEMKEGEAIIMYLPMLHHDEHVFENPSEFQRDRFLPDPSTGKKKVYRTKEGEVIQDPFRGFGGGAHYCPGRKFVATAAKNFVAGLIYQFDVKVEGETGLDQGRDACGVLEPTNDVGLTIKPRQR